MGLEVDWIRCFLVGQGGCWVKSPSRRVFFLLGCVLLEVRPLGILGLWYRYMLVVDRSAFYHSQDHEGRQRDSQSRLFSNNTLRQGPANEFFGSVSRSELCDLSHHSRPSTRSALSGFTAITACQSKDAEKTERHNSMIWWTKHSLLSSSPCSLPAVAELSCGNLSAH